MFALGGLFYYCYVYFSVRQKPFDCVGNSLAIKAIGDSLSHCCGLVLFSRQRTHHRINTRVFFSSFNFILHKSHRLCPCISNEYGSFGWCRGRRLMRKCVIGDCRHRRRMKYVSSSFSTAYSYFHCTECALSLQFFKLFINFDDVDETAKQINYWSRSRYTKIEIREIRL